MSSKSRRELRAKEFSDNPKGQTEIQKILLIFFNFFFPISHFIKRQVNWGGATKNVNYKLTRQQKT